MSATLIGWFSSLVLLLTLGRQVFSQRKSREVKGVSRWLRGPAGGVAGFSVYSYMLDNRVFLFTNLALLPTAVAGELIYLRNNKLAAAGTHPV